MIRFASFLFLLGCVICAGFGCAPAPSDVDCELPPAEPSIEGLVGPYGVGTFGSIRIRSETSMTFESSDPSVVRVGEIVPTDGRESEVKLHFVGAGSATLRLHDEVGMAEEVVEVRPVESVEVRLSAELLPIAIGELDGRILLADRQQVLVAYLDDEGQGLAGYGLAEVEISPEIPRCGEHSSAIEWHCFGFTEAGSYTLEVTVADETQTFRFETVERSDIVELELLQPDEDELEPGAWTRVEVVGVTEDGTQVSGLHSQYVANEVTYFGYFAYQYDPDARSQLLEANVFDETLYTRFRGMPSDETTYSWDCASVGPVSGGPIPQLLSLLGLMLLVRLNARRRRRARTEIPESVS